MKKLFIYHGCFLARYTILLCCFLSTLIAVGQVNNQANGTITDANSEPLIGVNVALKSNPKIGTITDIDGQFTLEAQSGDIITVSYIGYRTTEQAISSDGTITIIMAEATELLEEIVVVGYGSVVKKDLTGVVTKINADDFVQGAISSPEKLLTGKVAGLQISSSGEPGGSTTMRLRGTTSINASSSPLIVVDGVPLDTRNFQSSRNPLNFINANDIESMTVLKDASASAIYGSRGANGVIIITTKSGQTGKPKISYSGNVNASVFSGDTKNLSPNNFRAAINAKAPQEIEYLGDVNTDWVEEVTQVASSTEHNVAISGKTKKLGYYLSGGYLKANGVLKTSSHEKKTLSAKLSTDLFNENLSLTYKGKLGVTRDNRPPNVIGAALAFDPTRSVLDPDSKFGGYYQWRDPLATQNPVSTLNLSNNIGETTRALNNITAILKLPFIEGLSLTSNSSYDLTTGAKRELNDPLDKGNFDRGGRMFNEDLDNYGLLQETYGTYKKKYEDKSLGLEFTAGHSWQEFRQENRWTEGNGLVADDSGAYNATVDLRQDSFLVTNRLISFFGRVNLDYRDKYLLTLNMRRDGSSRFGPANKWGYFPGAAFAWRVLEEDFSSGLAKTFSDLKLRVSWGITGKEDITDFLFKTFYSYGTADASYQFGEDFQQTLRGTGVDPGIKWEQTSSLNVGLDFGLLNNRISGSVEVYSTYTRDLLARVAAPAFTNLSDRIVTNIGEMANNGIELQLSTVLMDTKNLDWNLSVNAAKNKNEIRKLDNASGQDLVDFQGYEVGGISGDVGQTIQILKVGESIGTFRTYHHLLDGAGQPLTDTEDHNGDGFTDQLDIYQDVNGDGLINENDLIISGKTALPDLILGLSTDIRYKKWDLSAILRANIGNYVYNNVASKDGYFDRLTDRVTNNIHESAFSLNIKNRQLKSDYYIEDASFVKLDNVSLGYSIKGTKIFQAIRFYATATNILTFTNYSGFDPEGPQFRRDGTSLKDTAEVGLGIDENVYPISRNFLFGLNVTF